MNTNPTSYSIAESAVRVQCRFNRILPSLPVPGTPHFPLLRDRFSPRGLRTSAIELETPNSKLSDVVLRFGLLGDELQVTFRLDQVELVFSSRAALTVQSVDELLQDVLAILDDIEDGLRFAEVRVVFFAHVRDGDSAWDRVRSRFKPSLEGWRSRSIQAEVAPRESFAFSSILCSLEASIRYPNALFIQWEGNLRPPSEIQGLLGQGALELAQALSLLLGQGGAGASAIIDPKP